MAVENIQLGICDITIGGTVVGETKGGCEVSFAPETYEITTDKHGTTPIDVYHIGMRIEIKVFMQETTLETYKQAIAGSSVTVGTTLNELNIGSNTGKLTPFTMTLHPKRMGSDTSLDYNVHRAVSIGQPTLGHKIDEETMMEATFLVLADVSQSAGEEMLRVGTAD